MPRLQSIMPLLRPLGAPGFSSYRPLLQFSTATRLRVDQPAKAASIPPEAQTAPPQQPPPTPEQDPSTPPKASRAADLAAAEAATEADNPTPSPEKPVLPSKRSKSKKSRPSSQDAATPSAVPIPTNTATNPNKPKKNRWSDEKKAAAAAERAAKAAAQGASESTLPREEKRALPSKSKTPRQPSLPLATPRYTISRSSTKNLPIYTDYKRGGNLHTTTVRKITGDISVLRDELRVYLNKADDEVRVNNLTQQVSVKGHHKPEIEKFLRDRGF